VTCLRRLDVTPFVTVGGPVRPRSLRQNANLSEELTGMLGRVRVPVEPGATRLYVRRRRPAGSLPVQREGVAATTPSTRNPATVLSAVKGALARARRLRRP
jgi:hypothetical protein